MLLFQSDLLWCGEIWYPCCIRHLPSQISGFAGILEHLGFPVSLCSQSWVGFFFLENHTPHYHFILLLVLSAPQYYK